ncbi:hypothetical protein KSC_000420 [Ktedonobacter sp. SOSP1-52]|nr:hypothetical protein KSC_000420 [Ktedonobacter sp. SOSP1-52]
MSSLVLIQVEDIGQIGVCQPLQLVFQVHPCFAQILPPRMQFLWKPLPALCPLESRRNQFWVHEQLADIVPHQVIELIGGKKARAALLVVAGENSMTLAPAGVVGVAMSGIRAPYASQVACSTTHERT